MIRIRSSISGTVLLLTLACSHADPEPNNGNSSGGSGTAAKGGAPAAQGGQPSSGGAAQGGTTASGGSAQGGSSNGGTTTANGGSSSGGSSSGGTTTANGGGGASTAGNGGSAGAPDPKWKAAISSQVTDQMLSDGYTAWKAKYTKTCDNGSAVVIMNDSVVSEGIGYGMLLSANNNDRTFFDGLFKYYNDHLDSNGLMNWKTGVCEGPGNNNQNAASDAELDVTMALIQANARWSDGGYLAKAKDLAGKIVKFETEDCNGRKILRPGDKFGGCSDSGQPRINPSYFAVGYYRVFANKFSDQASTWNALINGSYDLFAIYQGRMSGLVPDWSRTDGSDWSGSKYSWDACRTPWRVMIDYAYTGEPKARTFMEGVRTWFDANSSTLTEEQTNSAFHGAFALAAAYDQAKFDAAMTTWLNVKGDDVPYFQATLRLLYLLAAAGKFPSTM